MITSHLTRSTLKERSADYWTEILKALLKDEVLEFATGNQRQLLAAATGRLPEMGFGPRLGTTLPHAPGAKMT